MTLDQDLQQRLDNYFARVRQAAPPIEPGRYAPKPATPYPRRGTIRTALVAAAAVTAAVVVPTWVLSDDNPPSQSSDATDRSPQTSMSDVIEEIDRTAVAALPMDAVRDDTVQVRDANLRDLPPSEYGSASSVVVTYRVPEHTWEISVAVGFDNPRRSEGPRCDGSADGVLDCGGNIDSDGSWVTSDTLLMKQIHRDIYSLATPETAANEALDTLKVYRQVRIFTEEGIVVSASEAMQPPRSRDYEAGLIMDVAELQQAAPTSAVPDFVRATAGD